MASLLVSDPAGPSHTESPSSRSPVTSTLSSTVTAALGAAAATLRMLGILSDVTLREKGKDPAYDSDSDSDSSIASVDLIQGLRRTHRSDYHPETDLVLSGLAAYDTPVPVGSVYYWYF